MAVCTGCGLKVDAGLLIVDRNPDTTASGLECTAGQGLSLNVNHIDSGSATLTGLGTAASPLVAGVRIHPGDCNGITVALANDGIHSPCPDSLILDSVMTSIGAAIPHAVVGINNTYNRISDCTSSPGRVCVPGGGGTQLEFTNPTCCAIEGFATFQCYGGVLTGASADFDATAFSTVSVNNGPYLATIPNNVKYYGDADKTVFEMGGFQTMTYLFLPPGGVAQISAQFTVFVAAGSATWTVGSTFGLFLHMNQTGCC